MRQSSFQLFNAIWRAVIYLACGRAALFILTGTAIVLGGCAHTPPYVYHYVPYKTAILQNGYAVSPPSAPVEVQAAIAAANRITGMPYAYGGGHGRSFDRAYDCSGATSFVIEASGHLRDSMPAAAFRHYGKEGYGNWITIYARRDHVFLVVAGLRFDTGWTHGPKGPQWTTRSRPADGCVVRHPAGL